MKVYSSLFPSLHCFYPPPFKFRRARSRLSGALQLLRSEVSVNSKCVQPHLRKSLEFFNQAALGQHLVSSLPRLWYLGAVLQGLRGKKKVKRERKKNYLIKKNIYLNEMGQSFMNPKLFETEDGAGRHGRMIKIGRETGLPSTNQRQRNLSQLAVVQAGC